MPPVPVWLQNISIKLTIVIVYILFIISVSLYLNYCEPVNGKCSPKYPELSVRLYDPEWLPDGGVREGSDGEVYPRGSWWLGDGKVQGCPCSRVKPCLRKCCDQGHVFRISSNGSNVCVPWDGFTEPMLHFDTYEWLSGTGYTKTNLPPDHFQIFTEPKCKGVLNFTSNFAGKFILKSDGMLLYLTEDYIFDQMEFCVEHLQDMDTTVFLYCDKLIKRFAQKENLSEVLYTVSNTVSITVMALTLLVYCLVSRLRRGHGRPVMCYVTTSLLYRIVYPEASIPVSISYHPNCTLGAGSLVHFLVLAKTWWAAIVSYYMWIVARPGTTCLSESRFLFCCGLAWGVPLVIAVLGDAADRIPSVPDILKPEFGKRGICSFKNRTAKWIYIITPTVLANLAQLVFAMATLAQLAAGRRNAGSLHTAESRRHNADVKWVDVYTKATIVLGMDCLVVYLIGLMTWIVNVPPALLNVMVMLLHYRGVEVFLIFVCQWDVLNLAVKRLAFWR